MGDKKKATALRDCCKSLENILFTLTNTSVLLSYPSAWGESESTRSSKLSKMAMPFIWHSMCSLSAELCKSRMSFILIFWVCLSNR